MSTPRRFNEREIALIFERASLTQATANDAEANGDGLTLEELHEIGREVGLSPEHIAGAAAAVARGDLVPTRKRHWLGLPVGVSRTVDFDQPVTDAEWTQLVSALRETFDARGKLVTEGPFRQWHNGNLQALLEPTATGHRLRLSTMKGDGPARVWMGAGYLALAGIVALLGSTGALSSTASTSGAVLLASIGAGSLLSALYGLPRWARTRAAQMEEIARGAGRPSPYSKGSNVPSPIAAARPARAPAS